MNNNDKSVLPDVNKLIIERLKSHPNEVAELATKAIQLSETLPETSVFEALQRFIRELARKYGDQP